MVDTVPMLLMIGKVGILGGDIFWKLTWSPFLSVESNVLYGLFHKVSRGNFGHGVFPVT